MERTQNGSPGRIKKKVTYFESMIYDIEEKIPVGPQCVKNKTAPTDVTLIRSGSDFYLYWCRQLVSADNKYFSAVLRSFCTEQALYKSEQQTSRGRTGGWLQI
jgi:hypothetical protein